MASDSFRLQFLQSLSALIISAFGLVAALAWNETIKMAIAKLFDTPADELNIWGLFIYALLVTIIAVAATMIITRATNKLKIKMGIEEDKEEE